MLSRTALVLLLLAGPLWFWVHRSPEDLVEGEAKGLAAALSLPPGSARAAVDARLSELVTVNVSGVRRDLTRAELGAWIAEYLHSQGPRRVALDNLEIRVSGKRAQLDATAITSETQYGDLHSEERGVVAQFEFHERWLLRTLNLGVPAKYLPEARP